MKPHILKRETSRRVNTLWEQTINLVTRVSGMKLEIVPFMTFQARKKSQDENLCIGL